MAESSHDRHDLSPLPATNQKAVSLYALWCVLLVIAGAEWIAVLTVLNATAQAAVPRWVRARALAVYLLVFFGGMAAGSVLWGIVADKAGVSLSLIGSAAWHIDSDPVIGVIRLEQPTQ